MERKNKTSATRNLKWTGAFEALKCIATPGSSTILAIRILLMALLMALAWPAMEALADTDEAQMCLACHSQKGFSATTPSGQIRSLYVKPGALSGSVHQGLGCTSCHHGVSIGSHPGGEPAGVRALAQLASKSCSGCHMGLSGIHAQTIRKNKGLVCSDCHGGHEIKAGTGGVDNCLGCHSKPLVMEFEDGSHLSTQIDIHSLEASVHSKLQCRNCHFGFSFEEHPLRTFKGRRELTIAVSDSCRRCHFDKYTKTLEGIHYELLSHGDLSAPVCVDCHGAHSILSGKREKLMSARRCQKCHSGIYKTYIGSVHGQALLSEHNQDVPVCSDCHTAHEIAPAHGSGFRNRTPEMCGNCHADELLMATYGISTSVLQSYLEDFHGVTAEFYKKEGGADRLIAVCTDCHGIHDIAATRGTGGAGGAGTGTVRENLLKRCQKCHLGATENFPDSWMSHYEPSIKRAPLVYAVNLGYKIFIPFMIIGLVLQILLHVWRYAVSR